MQTALHQKLISASSEERSALESQMLADYARHSAFTRPLPPAGQCRLFSVFAGLEEMALTEDSDIVSVTSADQLTRSLNDRNCAMILVRSAAKISLALVQYLAEQSLLEKTIFIVK